MAGLVPAIHVLLLQRECTDADKAKDVDARHKAGHDQKISVMPWRRK
jgi:hypothetical protein